MHAPQCVGKILQSHVSCVCFAPTRMTLLVLLILSRNGLYLVEQPSQTLLHWHRRWQWLCNRVSYATWFHYKAPEAEIHAFSISVPTEVFTVQFWMALLGAATCKRTKMMGNIPTINGLDLGRLSKVTRQEKLKNKTTRPSARLDHDNRVRCVLSSCFVQSSWLLVSEASVSTAME